MRERGVVFTSHESQTTFDVKIETEENPHIIDDKQEKAMRGDVS